MNESPPLDEKQIEEIKKKRNFDEILSKKFNIPVHKVERELDPRLVRLFLQLLSQQSENRG